MLAQNRAKWMKWCADVQTLRATDDRRLLQWATGTSRSSLLVVGGPGAGKSAVVQDVETRISGRAVILRATASERAWHLAGVSNLMMLLALPGCTARIDGAVSSSPTVLHRLATGLLDDLRAADTRSVRVIVDDADLLDPASRAILGFLARRAPDSGLQMLLTAHAVANDHHLEGINRIDLRPIDRAMTAGLMLEVTGRPVQDGVVEAVVEASEGIPGLVHEIAVTLDPGVLEGSDALTLPFRPGPLASAISSDLVQNLDTDSLVALEVLSTSRSMSRDDVLGVAPGLRAAFEVLNSYGLISQHGTQVSIKRPVLRSAIYWGMPQYRRESLHDQLARTLSPRAPLRNWHRSFTDATSDGSLQLRVDALGLIVAGTHRAAIEMIERSLVASPPMDQDCDILLAIAEKFFHRGDFGFAERYVSIADSISASPRSHIAVASMWVRMEYLGQQNVLSTLAVDVLDRHAAAAPSEAATLLALLATYRAESWELDSADDLLLLVDKILPRVNATAQTIAASAQLLVDSMTGRAGLTQRLAPRSSHTVGQGPVATTALMTRARALTFAERYEDARGIFEMILQNREQVEGLWTITTLAYSVENDRLAGNFHGAMSTIEVLLQDTSMPHLHRPIRAHLEFWYWAERGDETASGAALDRIHHLNQGRRNASVSARVDAYRGARALHEGRLDAAVRLLMRTRVACDAVRNPQLHRSHADLVEALVRSDDRATACIVAADLAARCADAPSRWSKLALARCQALIAEDTDAIDRFRHLIAAHEARDLDYEKARTLTAFAGHLASAGMLPESAQLRRDASELYAQMGLPRWAQFLERERATRPMGGNHLSPSEWEVADLVLAGKRNREIAGSLFVSVRAVESRLTGLYRKLGVRSRTELIAALSPRLAPSELVLGTANSVRHFPQEPTEAIETLRPPAAICRGRKRRVDPDSPKP